ncbi:MAG: transglycosylase SLT domain-containing protein [Bacteroidales bacterium]|jgi:membrane-bound lytic murein transglycosylase D|nr:transglycosylase SLT domain-containing protein [Bacteroidales bacterium]MCI2145374.1 transglycosylase SLT domain-containing protein [Bacteroidales bacterium]
MNKVIFLSASLLLICCSYPAADAQIFKHSSKNTQIEEIKAKYDSLQQAFNELADDYAVLKDSLSNLDNEDTLQVELSDGEIVNDPLLNAADSIVNVDSLLSIWYVQRNVNNIDREIMAMDSIQFISNVPDSVYISRLDRMNSFIPLPYNKIVRNFIILYTEKMPEKIPEILGLSNYYMPIIEGILDKYDMPKELEAVAIIESALNPKAVSRAGAKGLWQFMYSTAKMYGLNISSFIDERYDPVKSTDAAVRYLRDSYAVFGDWMLAIASYNCGAGNVSKAIRRSGGSHDFWTIYPYLPHETRGYVPAFIGALYALNYYPEHGITPAVVNLPVHTDTFHVSKMVHFDQISYYTGASAEQIRNLNPEYTHDIIPGSAGNPCILILPYTYSMAYVDNEAEIPKYRDSVYFNPVKMKSIRESGTGSRIVHKVRRGETLGLLARRYHTTVSKIKKWNHLRGTTIRIGQRLYIYR